MALCPGYFGGAFAQRQDLARYESRFVLLLSSAGLGGLAGAVLLLSTPAALFRAAIPYLLVGACLVLGFQETIKRRLNVAAAHPSDGRLGRWVPVAVFLGAVYGGYFGAGLGVITLAILGLAIRDPLSKLNALKLALVGVTNVVAAILFVVSGRTVWTLAAVMAVASLLGGHVGGRVAGRMSPWVLRAIVIAIGAGVAIRFWLR